MKRFSRALAVGLGSLCAACAVVEYGASGGGGAGAGAGVAAGGGDTSGGFGDGGVAGMGEGGLGAVTSTTTDMGGSTDTGGSPPVLVLADTGLVARYYLDEAASGTPNGAMALDAAPNPLNLPIDFGLIAGGFHYSEIDGQRGLESVASGLNGRASVTNASATKLSTALAGSQTGTLEAVLEVSGLHMSNSRFIHFGTDEQSGRFTISAGSLDELNFYWRSNPLFPVDYLAGHWPVTWVPGDRVVLHVVLDSSQPAEIDRARLYRNGVLVTGNDTKNPVQSGETISFSDTDSFVLGNREVGERTFDGTLFYAAVYASALTNEEVVNNAAVLLASDDKPE